MRLHRSNKGFTLLEVMVALAIIATALVTLLGTHLLSLNLAYKNKEQTMATMLARQKMEEVLKDPFDKLLSGTDDFPDYPDYKWEVEIVDHDDIENLKRVTILIKLPGNDFSLETFVSRAEIEIK